MGKKYEDLTREEINNKISNYKRSKRICNYALVGGALMFLSTIGASFMDVLYSPARENNKIQSEIGYVNRSIQEINSSKLEKLSLLNPESRKLIQKLSNQRKQLLGDFQRLKELVEEEGDAFYSEHKDAIDEYNQRQANLSINAGVGGGLMIWSMILGFLGAGDKIRKYEKMSTRNKEKLHSLCS